MEELTMGTRISARRRDKGLTQEALANILGVSNQAVSKWEGDICCPDIALLPLLAAGVLYPLNFVLHPIDSVILMTLFVAWLLSGTARLNSFDPNPASQSEPQKEPAE